MKQLRFWTIVAFLRFILATLPWTIGIGKSGIERVQSYWTLWKASLRISVAWTVSGQKQNSQNQCRTFTEHSLNIQHHQQRLLIHKLVGCGSHLQHLDELMAQALTDVCSVTGPLVSRHIMKSKVRRLLCSVGTQLKSKDAQLRSKSESRSQLGTPRCMHPYGSHGLQETWQRYRLEDRKSTKSTKSCWMWALSTSAEHCHSLWHCTHGAAPCCTRHNDCNAPKFLSRCGTHGPVAVLWKVDVGRGEVALWHKAMSRHRLTSRLTSLRSRDPHGPRCHLSTEMDSNGAHRRNM